jgi:hypothetical protein
MNRIAFSLVILVALGLSGCWFGAKKPKVAPAPPVPAVAPTPTAAAKPAIKPEPRPEFDEEAEPEIPPNTTPPQIPADPAERLPKPKFPRGKVPPKPPPAVVTPPAAPAPTTTAQAPPAVPQLTVLLTDEQRTQYETDYQSSLQRAHEGLIRVTGFSLSSAQKESVSRIRSFMAQAKELHERDVVTAAQLAKRAAVLSEDLAQSIH